MTAEVRASLRCDECGATFTVTYDPPRPVSVREARRWARGSGWTRGLRRDYCWRHNGPDRVRPGEKVLHMVPMAPPAAAHEPGTPDDFDA